MQSLIIHGRRRLAGQVQAAGSKNAALPIMAAAILAEGPLRLTNVPDVADVRTMARLLESLGLDVDRSTLGGATIATVDPLPSLAHERWVRRMRASFCVLGPLLARRGRAVVALPGGCRIGPRPVELHLAGLAALGAQLRIDRGYVVASARRLRGARLKLAGARGPTVTGTANLLCATALARGKSLLEGAATEPEVVALGRMLIDMGARIAGLGTSRIEVTGVDGLAAADVAIEGDRIEAGTLLLAAAITRGSVRVTGIAPAGLASVTSQLVAAGARIATGDDWIEAALDSRPRAVDLVAEPYPGFPTDLQAPWTALMATAVGKSRITDNVFPERWAHVAEMCRLGASIGVGRGEIGVRGVARLSGAELRASDLRATAALVLAGMAAEGRTTIRRIAALDRGYEGLEVKLTDLGARIERTTTGSGSSRKSQ